MKITKDNNNLIITIPLFQKDYDALDNEIGEIPNIIGVIEGEEQGFAHLSSRSYKGSAPDICEIFIKTGFEDDEFRKLCKDLDIECYEYPICKKCDKPIYGCCTIGDEGFIHNDIILDTLSIVTQVDFL